MPFYSTNSYFGERLYFAYEGSDGRGSWVQEMTEGGKKLIWISCVGEGGDRANTYLG